MENVIDAIEKQILNGELRLHTEPAPRVVLVMEDGIVTTSYTNTPFIQAEVIKLDKEYDSGEEREAVYGALKHDPELTECECHIPGPDVKRRPPDDKCLQEYTRKYTDKDLCFTRVYRRSDRSHCQHRLRGSVRSMKAAYESALDG